MISSRRIALVSLVVLFGAAACGDPNANTSSAGTTVITSAPAKPPVIHLVGGWRNFAGGAAPAAAESATDSKMAIWGVTEFVYDGELPALDGLAPSWYFPSGQQPDLARVAELAKALGVEGEVRSQPADQGGGWAVGPEDYSGPVLTVGSDGLLSWWLSGTPASISARPGCVVADSSGGGSAEPAPGEGVAGSSGTATEPGIATPDTALPVDKVDPAVTPECAEPQPPANVPTADEALAKAKELFTSWGYDLSSYEFDTPYADDWSASVNASLIIDGMKAPITLSIGFGENGSISWASGSLATPLPGADYPTIGAAAGLDRLKEQQNQYMALDTGIAKGAPDAAVSEPAIAPICDPAVTNDIASDCAIPNPEPVTVTLNSVKRDLTMLWDADNTIWLLPAYSFGSADGGIYTVIAVDDAYIEEAEAPATTEPAVIVPDTAVAPPALSVACQPLPEITIPTPDDAIRYLADAVVGYCLADAQKIADTFGYTIRVVREDGVDLEATADYSETRINVAVENGAVTEVVSMG
ncbi:MAG TPA: hypothetical protein VH761_15295 [Ilumatobacteraceae bacterium]